LCLEVILIYPLTFVPQKTKMLYLFPRLKSDFSISKFEDTHQEYSLALLALSSYVTLDNFRSPLHFSHQCYPYFAILAHNRRQFF
jgi:hypothetical protein